MNQNGQQNIVIAAPTKAFFVRMLIRDIALRDAILDLLDNCIDGILRSGPRTDSAKPYSNFYANITATPEQFIIEDNCGGIDRDTAINVAFRLGRPPGVEPDKIETVGMYGIGMKRAIFKLGRNAVVTSEHAGDRFRVEITPEWLTKEPDPADPESAWNLRLADEAATGKSGVRIVVTDLHPEIQREFAPNQSTFLTKELTEVIQDHYAIIMGKGFEVTLNGVRIAPVEFKMLIARPAKGVAQIAPYVFRGRFGLVSVEIIVGFYRKPLTEAEIDEENEAPKADLSQAGWSIICNDRIVLRSDKTAMTGWGTATVPRFHNQFSSIAGVVILRSTSPELLPLNTTKRGIETSSEIYFRLLDYMREGTKKFTDFTNHWKKAEDDSRAAFSDARVVAASNVADVIPKFDFRTIC